MADALQPFLGFDNNVVIVSGDAFEKVSQQLGEDLTFLCSLLVQNGNDGFMRGQKLLWSNPLTWLEKHDAMYWCWEILHRLEIPRGQWEDMVQDRGCQISFSMTGHSAPLQDKKRYDPSGKKRREVLEAMPFMAISNVKIEIAVNGMTTLDLFREGCNKAANIERMMKTMAWEEKDCVFIANETPEKTMAVLKEHVIQK